jgi:hypothetical protein
MTITDYEEHSTLDKPKGCWFESNRGSTIFRTLPTLTPRQTQPAAWLAAGDWVNFSRSSRNVSAHL